MNAIAWMAQQPRLRPHWVPRQIAPTPTHDRRSARVRAEMSAIENELDRSGPLSPGQLRTVMGCHVARVHDLLMKLEHEGRVRLHRWPAPYLRGAGVLVMLPWHLDEEIGPAIAAAERHHFRAMRAGMSKVDRTGASREYERRLREIVRDSGEVCFNDLRRSAFPTDRLLHQAVRALAGEGAICIESRPARGGKGRPGRWLVWVGETA